MQREGLALQLDAPKPDKPSPPQDKVKAERQANFEKSKQAKTARNEQTKREKEQRQKQKEKEKDGICPSCDSLYIAHRHTLGNVEQPCASSTDLPDAYSPSLLAAAHYVEPTHANYPSPSFFCNSIAYGLLKGPAVYAPPQARA